MWHQHSLADEQQDDPNFFTHSFFVSTLNLMPIMVPWCWNFNHFHQKILWFQSLAMVFPAKWANPVIFRDWHRVRWLPPSAAMPRMPTPWGERRWGQVDLMLDFCWLICWVITYQKTIWTYMNLNMYCRLNMIYIYMISNTIWNYMNCWISIL